MLSYICRIGELGVNPAFRRALARAASMTVQSSHVSGIDLLWYPTIPAISTSIISRICSWVRRGSLAVSFRMVIADLLTSSLAGSRPFIQLGLMSCPRYLYSCVGG